MSRIGKLPVTLVKGVEVSFKDEVLTVKGPKGELVQEIKGGIGFELSETDVVVTRPSDSKEHKSLHGLYRSLLNNMITGVTQGFKIQQELIGVGYRASVNGKRLELALGYSHPIVLELPSEINATAETVKGQPPLLTLESHDKQLVGQVAAKIRSFRKPEPYKGKGIRFKGEQVRRKAGKAASK